jgi:hypothetical protein
MIEGEDNHRSWQPQIEINGKWRGNGYRFATRKEALRFADSIAARRAFKGDDIGEVRAVETTDPVNQDEDEG